MMLVYLVGYADWHAINATESRLGLEAHEHDHNGHDHGHGSDGTVATLIDHLRDDPIALASKVAETVGLVSVAILGLTTERS